MSIMSEYFEEQIRETHEKGVHLGVDITITSLVQAFSNMANTYPGEKLLHKDISDLISQSKPIVLKHIDRIYKDFNEKPNNTTNN